MTSVGDASAVLDAEELLHLAIIDSRAGRHDAAILKLKQAVQQAPEHAGAHFMLAAEHAEIGLLDRAVDGMRMAVQLSPQLYTGHLQLGLIHFTQNRLEEARQAWKALDALGSEHAMVLFANGLLTLGDGEPRDALELLERAAGAEKENPALLSDIERVIANVKRHLEQRPAGAPATGTEPGHLFVRRYDDAARGERDDS